MFNPSAFTSAFLTQETPEEHEHKGLCTQCVPISSSFMVRRGRRGRR